MSNNLNQILVTQDGKRVILKADGTWEYAQESSQAIILGTELGFRKTAWGMTKDQVKQIEGRDDAEENTNLLIYNGQIAGLSCLIAYIFVQNQLVRGKYIINAEHSNDNSYLADYRNLKEMLIKKYGSPKKDDTIWLDDHLYCDTPQEWGMAVSIGHLYFYAEWSTKDTDINLMLSGDNYQINLGVEYISKRLGDLEHQEKEQQALDEL